MWRVVLKLLAITLLTLVAVPIAFLIRAVAKPHHVLIFARGYSGVFAKIIGLRVTVRGAINKQRPLLMVSNHISYLDIIALGSAAPLTFIPKSEIEHWPVIGFLCKLVGCVFVHRVRTKTKENLAGIHQGLNDGKPLVLFAEGTTGNGKTMFPIRSSYFQLAETFDGDLHIQPVVIRYDKVHGLPMDEATRHRIAWVGDEGLAPHAKELFQLGPIDVSVHFLDEVDLTGCKTRKEIASKCTSLMQSYVASLP